tara:strand:- start:4644 stop:6290 length:1647 start_codon:yes stop_codon:yes gene_type:complete
MATGYGYVRDSKPLRINWEEIGNRMSESVERELEGREQRKDKIDQGIADYNKSLLDQPQGTNAEVNRFMGDFTSDAGDAMRKAERLLKSGQMSERDFYKFRANANQGTGLMFEAGKKFNEGYDEAMRRFGAGESQAKENWMRQQTEGFLNFADNGAYINPLTGEVNVARRDKVTGVISTNPGDFANASELVQQATRQYDSFDLDGAVNNAVKGLRTTLIRESNGRTTKQFFQALQDGTLDDEEVALLAKAKIDMVASFTVNPDNVSSILTGNIGALPEKEGGASYDFTYDEEEAKKNPHLILVNPDGTNNFDTPNGKKQLEAAQKYAEARFEASLGGERKEPNDLDNELKRQRIEALKRSGQKEEEDEEDIPYISNVNVIATEEGSDLAKKTIRALNEDSLNEENFDKTVEVITNVFDNQNFPPGATLNKVDPYVYQPEVTEEIIVGSATGPRKEFKTTLEESTVDALELFVPGIMIEPIRVPSGEGFAKSLDKIINLLDTRKKSDRPVGKEEFINFFENKEIFDRYNPIEQKDQTNIKADTTKKKFG